MKAGMVKNELRSMYNFHRRNESSKPWRNRYTPKWKSLYKDLALRLGSRRGTIYSNATSQLDRPRATVSRSSAIMAPSSNLEANYLSSNFYTNFEANISPTRAAAPALYDALAAQKYYLPANQNSGGGRTEETRDRVNQQQIDRSRISNRTRARGTEIAAGTTSADGWTTFPAKRQVAAIEMRVGQNGGPLPFEAIIDFDEPIVYFLHGPSRRAFFATKPGLRRTRVTIPGVFCNSFYAKGHGGGGGRCDGDGDGRGGEVAQDDLQQRARAAIMEAVELRRRDFDGGIEIGNNGRFEPVGTRAIERLGGGRKNLDGIGSAEFATDVFVDTAVSRNGRRERRKIGG